jgi:hypothetical protein
MTLWDCGFIFCVMGLAWDEWGEMTCEKPLYRRLPVERLFFVSFFVQKWS